MNDPVAQAARRAAKELAALAPGVRSDVEAALDSRAGAQFLDPISLGALIVSAAQLAWTIRRDRAQHASPDAVAHELRVELVFPTDVAPQLRDRIVEAVAREAVAVSEETRS